MRKAYVYPHAAVASPHYLATAAGLRVLMDGGNAVDAAVAVNLVLAVVCPQSCGVGGDLFGIVFNDGEVHGLNSSGTLPMAAELPADGKVPQRGIGSVTVPGAVAGWLTLLERFGTVSIKELAAPAIRYAREGFLATPGLVRSIEASKKLLGSDPEFSRIFLALKEGRFSNPLLAETLEDIENFYTGAVAQNAPPPFTPQDFAAHRAQWVEPMHTTFRDVEVYEMPPNSRGHLVLEALKILEPLDGLTDKDPEFHLRLIKAIHTATNPEGDTVYLCTHDENGMAVSINESNFMGFGSGVAIPGTGVHLQNRGAYHTPETYRGGERPVHTLAPAMALKDGEPKLVFGTMGGDAQIQIHMQLLARVFVLGQDPLEALSAPRWAKQGKEGKVVAEEGLPDIGAVERSAGIGHAHMILRTKGGLAAAADPRTSSLAAGY